MIRFDTINKIFLYSGPTSMRFGIYKIQQLVAFNFSPGEIINSIFVFCSRSKKIIKIYYENEYGFWLLQNRLNEGTFKWPDVGELVNVDKRQLDWLLKGLDVIEHKPKPQLDAKYY